MNPIDTSEKEKTKDEFGPAYGSKPVWQKFISAAFNQKSGQISGQLSTLKNGNEHFKKLDLEREIRKKFNDCP